MSWAWRIVAGISNHTAFNTSNADGVSPTIKYILHNGLLASSLRTRSTLEGNKYSKKNTHADTKRTQNGSDRSFFLHNEILTTLKRVRERCATATNWVRSAILTGIFVVLVVLRLVLYDYLCESESLYTLSGIQDPLGDCVSRHKNRPAIKHVFAYKAENVRNT